MLQQAWWIASEIARRDGSLLISRVEDDDSNVLLIVHRGPVGLRVQFDLLRGAQWQNDIGTIEWLLWREIVTLHNPHSAVTCIEEKAGFGVPELEAPTNRRTIAYRVAAAILAAKVDDRHSWQVVPAPLVSSETQTQQTLATLETFASTADQVEYALADITELAEQAVALKKTPYWHDPFWLVLKDLQPAMVLDESGYAHLPDGVLLDLMSLYELLDHEITAVAGVVLMPPDAALATNLNLEGRTE